MVRFKDVALLAIPDTGRLDTRYLGSIGRISDYSTKVEGSKLSETLKYQGIW